MNDNAPACTRLLYIDTLSRFVGPFLGFGVVNAANTNSAHLPSLRAGGGFLSVATPTPICPINPHTPSHSGDVA